MGLPARSRRAREDGLFIGHVRPLPRAQPLRPVVAWRGLAAIRGAIYQLLAAQPGIINVGTVIVPDGRSGTGLAVSGGASDFLIIDPGTAQAIAWGTGTLHQGETLTPASVSSLEEYETMGWTSQLGG